MTTYIVSKTIGFCSTVKTLETVKESILRIGCEQIVGKSGLLNVESVSHLRLFLFVVIRNAINLKSPK